jgi:hypothetical protein
MEALKMTEATASNVSQKSPSCASCSGDDWPLHSTEHALRGADPQQDRHRLAKIHHAVYCKHEGRDCPVEPHCFAMKCLYRHMIKCKKGKSCRVPACSKSGRVWRHYRNCRLEGCLTCMLVPPQYQVPRLASKESGKTTTRKNEDQPAQTSTYVSFTEVTPLLPFPRGSKRQAKSFQTLDGRNDRTVSADRSTAIVSIATSMAALRIQSPPPSPPSLAPKKSRRLSNNIRLTDRMNTMSDEKKEEDCDEHDKFAVWNTLATSTKKEWEGIELFLDSNDDLLDQAARRWIRALI